MEELQNKLMEYLGAAESALTDLGPKAWEATVGLVHLNGWLSLIAVFVTIVSAVVVAVVGANVAPKAWAKHEEKTKNQTYPDATVHGAIAVVVGCGSAIGATVLAIMGVVGAVDRGMWIAIVNPELGLLWEVYQKFLAQ